MLQEQDLQIMIKKVDFEDKNKLDQKVEICEECKKSDDSVLQNLILTGFKICKSCRISKTIFPI